jgi:predicted anti-sigma-YlaC factor YlaD
MNDVVACETVRMSALAALDGEAAPMTPDAIRAHLAGCAACREVVAALGATHARLDQLELDAPAVDLWPVLRPRIAAAAPKPVARERWAIAAMAAVLIVWRTVQLSVESLVPFIGTLAPLAMATWILWKMAGDPFAIEDSVPELRQEGV